MGLKYCKDLWCNVLNLENKQCIQITKNGSCGHCAIYKALQK